MKNINKIFILSIIFFLAVGTVSATELDDATDDVSDMTSVDAPQVIETTNTVSDVANTELNELNTEEETQICTGRTYSNPITITPNNYQTDMSNIYNYDAVEFSGTFTSTLTGGSISITSPIVFTSISGATFEDTQFVINSDDVTIKNLIIENDDGTSGSAISATGYDNIEVINNSITVTKTTAGETVGIKFNSTNNQTICGNNITMNIYPQYRWEEIPSTPYNIWLFHLYNSAIVVDDSYDVYVRYNKIISTNSTITEVNGTNEGINIRNSHDIEVTYNDVTITNGDYGYGITFENVLYSTVTYNNVDVTTHNYACLLQLTESKNITVSYNNLTASARNTTTPAGFETVVYGIYMSTNYGLYNNYNNIISFNKIIVDASVAYGIEGYIVTNNVITNNVISVTGNVSMGIGLFNSSGINITNNIITVTGETRTLNSDFYEMIPPETTGIKTLAKEDTLKNNINNNVIVVSDINVDELFAVILEDDNNNVTYNVLSAGSNAGDYAVFDIFETMGANVIQQNQ